MEPGAGWDAPATVPEGLANEALWREVALPHHRHRSLAADSSTVAAPPEVRWYRWPVTGGDRTTHLYLPRWQTIGTVAVYADGQLVYRTRGSRVWNSFNRPLWVPLAEATGAPPSVVMIRMASQQGVGGAISTAWLGPEASLQWRYRVRLWLQSDLINLTAASFVVIGLFSMAVWCVRRRESLYALFFVTSVFGALRALHYTVGDLPPVLPDAWFGWITVNSLAWTMVSVFLFSFHVHGHPLPRLKRLVLMLVLVMSLCTLPMPLVLPHLDAIMPLVYVLIAALIAVVALSGLYLAPYVSTGLFAIFLVIVYRRYFGAIRAVEVANAGLGSQLAARERELTASHEQLRALERAQTLAAERQRLMQDMHDGIGSSLMSALRMVECGQASTADTALVLKDCIDDLKLAIDSLTPADADLLALLAALRFRLAPRLKVAGITLTWSVQDLPPLPWLDPQAALHVLRILQEVLTNILKHSQATAIDLATEAHPEVGAQQASVLVRIRDNGRAFVPTASAPHAPQAGQGLANVRHRAQALGGHGQWAAWEGGGEFRLWLPLERGGSDGCGLL